MDTHGHGLNYNIKTTASFDGGLKPWISSFKWNLNQIDRNNKHTLLATDIGRQQHFQQPTKTAAHKWPQEQRREPYDAKFNLSKVFPQ